jgi:hypothetical protein
LGKLYAELLSGSFDVELCLEDCIDLSLAISLAEAVVGVGSIEVVQACHLLTADRARTVVLRPSELYRPCRQLSLPHRRSVHNPWPCIHVGMSQRRIA